MEWRLGMPLLGIQHKSPSSLPVPVYWHNSWIFVSSFHNEGSKLVAGLQKERPSWGPPHQKSELQWQRCSQRSMLPYIIPRPTLLTWPASHELYACAWVVEFCMCLKTPVRLDLVHILRAITPAAIGIFIGVSLAWNSLPCA